MKQLSGLVKTALFLGLLALSVGRPARADALSYTLLPGSTITPYLGAVPIGPPEPLTGRFDWIQVDTGTTVIGFDATLLNFRSASFFITLNTTVNDLFTSVFPDSCLTLFGETVDLTGLGASVGEMLSSDNNGCYAGPPDRPDSLSYSNVSIAPVNGGLFVARLSITAALDSDGDGVPDESDQCPNTAAGAIVDAHGCSIDQLVPCAGPVSGGTWNNHGRYVSTVVKTAARFLAAGLITDNEKEAIVEAAARSKCGQR